MNLVRVGVLTWLCISFGVHAEESLTSEKKLFLNYPQKKLKSFIKTGPPLSVGLLQAISANLHVFKKMN